MNQMITQTQILNDSNKKKSCKTANNIINVNETKYEVYLEDFVHSILLNNSITKI